jgi:hypothetical protein
MSQQALARREAFAGSAREYILNLYCLFINLLSRALSHENDAGLEIVEGVFWEFSFGALDW